MENRQHRLEAKASTLSRAATWTERLSKIALLVAGLAILDGVVAITQLAQSSALATAALWEPSTDLLVQSLGLLFVSWWAQRIADAFSSIVDLIHEMAETV